MFNLTSDSVKPEEENSLDIKVGKNLKKTLEIGIGSILIWAAKEYLPPLFREFKESLHKQIEINSSKDPELYEKVDIWLEKQDRIYCSQYVTKSVAKQNKVKLSVGFCPAIYKINNKICIIERAKDDRKDNGYYGGNSEKIIIKMLYTKDLEVVDNVLKDIMSINIEKENSDRVKVIYGWNEFYKNKRGLNTIAIKQEDKELIVNDIQKFLDSKDTYEKKGITYKRNYLLYGEAGCGKTSFIWALASHFGKTIRIADISTLNSPSELQHLLTRNKDSFLVFEDIDAMNIDVQERELEKVSDSSDSNQVLTPTETPKISMSSILNIFDGLSTPDGSICFFTTNHISSLDKAFLREGRMDVKLEIGKVGKREIIDNIANRFLDDSEIELLEENVSNGILINPALAQDIVMKHSLQEIITKINESSDKK